MSKPRSVARKILFPSLLATLFSGQVLTAGIVPNYDFQWSTIGAVGNAPYTGGPVGQLAGRGGVDYEYRMSKFEVSSGQWLEFLNTYAAMGDPFGFRFTHSDSIVQDFSHTGPGTGFMLHPDIANAAQVPVIGLSWRNAARYANWLHNDKAPTLEAIAGGAYDTSTWGMNPDTGNFTDAAAHEPGAKFWIPTADEWLKAAHYDPNHSGIGQGGWWDYPNGADSPLLPGPPGLGQTSAGYVAGPGQLPEYLIPLGAYAGVQSPWGLFDVSGGAAEWVEDWVFPNLHTQRMFDGAPAGDPFYSPLDSIYQHSSRSPAAFNGNVGLRLASATIPTPGVVSVFLLALCSNLFHRRRLS